jgi:hypothetical protein
MRQWEDCRTYVNYLLVEHRELDEELHGIRASLQMAQPEEVLRRLNLLRDELRRHFAEEEEGGCLEEAISCCPKVAKEADALLGQHPTLLAKLEHLIACLQSARRLELRAGFDEELTQFTRELLVHEADENQVMRRAFGTMMNGDGDDED